MDKWKDINFKTTSYKYQINQDKEIRMITELNGNVSIAYIEPYKKNGKLWVNITDDNNEAMDFEVNKIFNVTFETKREGGKKLSRIERENILKDWESGEYTQTDLSRKYSVGIPSIHLLVRKKSYNND